jgi:hypothetical protein
MPVTISGSSGIQIDGNDVVTVVGSPADGQVIAYDSATSEWNPSTLPAGYVAESGEASWIINGSGTETQTVTFSTSFSATPAIWADHDAQVSEVNISSASSSGFTWAAPWSTGSPTGAYVRWYAVGPA